MFKLTMVRTILAWIGAITVVLVFGTAIAQGVDGLLGILREAGVKV